MPGDEDLLLKSAQVDIVQAHFGRQRDQHLPPVFPGGLQVGLRRLDPPSCSTKDVQLPGASRPAWKRSLVAGTTVGCRVVAPDEPKEDLVLRLRL